MKQESVILLPGLWIDGLKFDSALSGTDPRARRHRRVRFEIPLDCKVMVDAALRLLSLANQLDTAGKEVLLAFEEGCQAWGYLSRIGFFDRLRAGVRVLPERPSVSGAAVYRGMSRTVVEIESISPEGAPRDLPTRLVDALVANVGITAREGGLEQAAFTVFAELIQNIQLHSATALDGFAALQVYQQGGRAKVAVSDSGEGILATLRPALRIRRPGLAELADTDLIVETFRRGLSRHGEGRGCGLKASADHALRFQAELDVRLATCRVHLRPSPDGYRPNVAWCTEGLPRLDGTHVCFDFRLDS